MDPPRDRSVPSDAEGRIGLDLIRDDLRGWPLALSDSQPDTPLSSKTVSVARYKVSRLPGDFDEALKEADSLAARLYERVRSLGGSHQRDSELCAVDKEAYDSLGPFRRAQFGGMDEWFQAHSKELRKRFELVPRESAERERALAETRQAFRHCLVR